MLEDIILEYSEITFLCKKKRYHFKTNSQEEKNRAVSTSPNPASLSANFCIDKWFNEKK